MLAKFVVEFRKEDPKVTTSDRNWILKVDGASCKQSVGIRIHLTSPHSEVIEQSFRLDFIASYNEAEYAVQLVKVVYTKQVHAFCDSLLVANRFSGEYKVREDQIEACIKVIKSLTKQFDQLKHTYIPIGENNLMDALDALASISDLELKRIIQPSIAITVNSIMAIEGGIWKRKSPVTPSLGQL